MYVYSIAPSGVFAFVLTFDGASIEESYLFRSWVDKAFVLRFEAFSCKYIVVEIGNQFLYFCLSYKTIDKEDFSLLLAYVILYYYSNRLTSKQQSDTRYKTDNTLMLG